MIIDILLMVGGKSGFELALNRTADYLSAHGHRIRFFQLISSNFVWHTPNSEFHCFNMNSDISLPESASKYSEFLSIHEKPDLTIATGMPEVLYPAKIGLQNANVSVPVILWLQNDLHYYGIQDTASAQMLDFADFVYATNDEMAASIGSFFPDKTIYRVYNPINPKNIVYSENRDTSKIAFVGRLSVEKNPSVILEAMNMSNSDFEVTFIGQGEEKEHLLDICRKYNLEKRVSFLDWSDEPWSVLKDHGALIVSSNAFFEGGPMTCVEALACGIPVISTRVGFVPELIKEGVNGSFFPFGGANYLAAILDNFTRENFSPETARACRDAIADFIPEVALWDFLCKLYACKNLIGLPQRRWQDKEKRVIRSKLSVIISDLDISQAFLESTLKCLISQTIEKRYLEIIIVSCNKSEECISIIKDYESKYPDLFLIVNCENLDSVKEAYSIGMQYTSGDFTTFMECSCNEISQSYLEEYYINKICGIS